jgi:hypothetical protein
VQKIGTELYKNKEQSAPAGGPSADAKKKDDGVVEGEVVDGK